ncbi:Uncharacterised protein [Sphingobacterium daejeonense]|nr:Uncharacterised protein [Sphingobacterium daejeonense]
MEQLKNQENLEKIISQITSKYNIEQIYLNTYNRDNLPPRTDHPRIQQVCQGFRRSGSKDC